MTVKTQQAPIQKKARFKPIVMEGVRLIYKNFSGKASKFNAEGNRKFSVLLTEDMASQLKAIGCNIKRTKPREDGDLAIPYVEVKVNFSENSTPPKIVVIKNERQAELTKSSIHILDWAKIITADISIIPYQWEVKGDSGVKPYLKALYATLEVDALEEKYAPKDNQQETPL